MVAPRRRNAGDSSERGKRAKRYLVVIALCFIAVYMLADEEELVDVERQNPNQRSEPKPNPNQLRGMPDNRMNNEMPDNNGDSTIAGSGFGAGGDGSPSDTHPNNNENSFSSLGNNGNNFPDNTENNFPDNNGNNFPDNNGNNFSDNNKNNPPDNTNMEHQPGEVAGNKGEMMNEFVESVEQPKDINYYAESNNNEQLDQKLVMEDQQQQQQKQQQDETNWQELQESDMVKHANDEEANQELSVAINDVKMDIEEAEEEQVMKEVDSQLMQPLHDAEEDMKLVMEQMLKEQKYEMSKDALEKMEKEVVDRLEDEVNNEFNEIAEKIAKEKEEEIDVVVIEDRNVYPNPAHIEKDIKKMEKYFIDDMAREIDESASNIKKFIPSKIENITMAVMEEKTGLHIKEGYLKATEKIVEDKKHTILTKKESPTETTEVKKSNTGKKKKKTGGTKKGTSKISANKDDKNDLVRVTDEGNISNKTTSKIVTGTSKEPVDDKHVSTEPTTVNDKDVVEVEGNVSDTTVDNNDEKGGDVPTGSNVIESVSQVVREEEADEELPSEDEDKE